MQPLPAPQGALPGGVPAASRAPNTAARQHAAGLFPAAGACPRVPSPHPGTLQSSMLLSRQHWSSLAPTAPSPKLGWGGRSWEVRDPAGRGKCPFLLPAMQTETEKDQIPKFLFKPRHRSPGGGVGTVTCWRDGWLWAGPVALGVGNGHICCAWRDKGWSLATMTLQPWALVSALLLLHPRARSASRGGDHGVPRG